MRLERVTRMGPERRSLIAKKACKRCSTQKRRCDRAIPDCGLCTRYRNESCSLVLSNITNWAFVDFIKYAIMNSPKHLPPAMVFHQAQSQIYLSSQNYLHQVNSRGLSFRKFGPSQLKISSQYTADQSSPGSPLFRHPDLVVN